ncbi:MAG TPA: AMP-binding protein [Patescibacteria group bacterium]|jgi:long-chain acyl-CoA synthetase|nr:AMP-binding protein [Patescibacteria group bacterium]
MKNESQTIRLFSAEQYVQKLFERAVRIFPDNIFLIYKQQTLSYKNMYHAVMHCALLMQQRGVKQQDCVLIWCDNSPLFYVGYFAAWQLGAVVVPLNSFLKIPEVEHVLKDCKPTFLVADQQHLTMLTSIDAVKQLVGYMHEQDLCFDEYTKEPVCIENSKLNAQQMAALIYTSGTTGVPKGVMLSSANIMANVNQCITRLEVTSKERLLCVLPLFHVFTQITCVWLAVALGVSVILVPKIERAHIIEGLTKKPTIILGVPALFGLFCLLRSLDFSAVRLFVSGGDAMPDKIRCLFALLYGRKIINGYGLSEASPVVAVHVEDTFCYSNTVGRLLDGIALQIRFPDGAICQKEQIGDLFIKGDNVMLGYYNDQKATDAVLRDGWLNTGDCAYLDQDGLIVITGREKDLIISKGFNVYPQEVENIIMQHPAVIRAAVVGKEDEINGEVVIAFVQLRTESKNIQKELATLCVHHLAAYKLPRLFICSSVDLPMTSTGKIDKKQLRKQIKNTID